MSLLAVLVARHSELSKPLKNERRCTLGFLTAGGQATHSAEVRVGCIVEFLGESWQWGAHGK